MLNTLLFLLYALSSLSVSFCAFTLNAQEAPDLEELFNPQPKGWLGADVSTSIPFNDNMYLWLWGDTLVGNIVGSGDAAYRNLSAFPHSSIGFMNMSGDHIPKFFFKSLPNSPEIDPMGMFTPQNPTDPNEYYWTVAGIVAPTTRNLVVVAQVIIAVSGGLGFQQLGTDIVLVANPLESPEQWSYETSRIPSSNANLTWNSGIAFFDGYFYLVGLESENAYLCRITEVNLVKLNWEGMEFWTEGSEWSTSSTSLLSIYPSVCTEGTLQYHPYMKQWFLILAQAYQGSAYIAHADNITGPYTVTRIYDFPPQYQNGTFFSYAGKSHPEFASEQEVIFTYNVNCGPLDLLYHDLDIYHPKFVRVTISQR